MAYSPSGRRGSVSTEPPPPSSPLAEVLAEVLVEVLVEVLAEALAKTLAGSRFDRAINVARGEGGDPTLWKTAAYEGRKITVDTPR